MSDLNVSLLRSFCVERFNKRNLGPIHGVSHWDRVAENGKRLFCPGADTDVINAFAYLHDVERYNNGRDLQHGERATRVIDNIRHDLLSALSDVQVDKLKRACKQHTTTAKTGDITIDICFDADRLDLNRVGIIPDPARMATIKGKEFAMKAIEETKGKKYIFALYDTAQKFYNPVISDIDLAVGAFRKYGVYNDNRYAMIEAANKYAFSNEVFGKLLHTAFVFGASPITKLREEKALFDRVNKCYYMSKQEMQYYDNLPDSVTLYRGTSKKDLQSGIISPSWTDDLETAIKFAQCGYYGNDDSPRIVIKVKADKKQIKAVFIQALAIYACASAEIVYYHAGYRGIKIIREVDPFPFCFANHASQIRLNGMWLYSKEAKAVRETEFLSKAVGLWPKE